jgi:hypothetical protein
VHRVIDFSVDVDVDVEAVRERAPPAELPPSMEVKTQSSNDEQPLEIAWRVLNRVPVVGHAAKANRSRARAKKVEGNRMGETQTF